jgi:hypothetical protein
VTTFYHDCTTAVDVQLSVSFFIYTIASPHPPVPQRPPSGPGPPHYPGFTITDAPQSVGLLCTSDQGMQRAWQLPRDVASDEGFLCDKRAVFAETIKETPCISSLAFILLIVSSFHFIFGKKLVRNLYPPQLVSVSFPGVKRPGRGVDHKPPSRAVVKQRVELHPCTPPLDLHGLFRVNFTFYLYPPIASGKQSSELC